MFTSLPTILTDAPLTTTHAHEVVKEVRDFKGFFLYLKIGEKETVTKTMEFYLDEPFFQASWKHIALGLYNTFEDWSIDKLFLYMKSPPGECL